MKWQKTKGTFILFGKNIGGTFEAKGHGPSLSMEAVDPTQAAHPQWGSASRKTWLLKRFGEDHFDQLLYFNCEGNDILKAVFEVDFPMERIIRSLLGLSGATTIDPKRTFISHVAHHDRPVATTSPAAARSSHNGSPVPPSAAPCAATLPAAPRARPSACIPTARRPAEAGLPKDRPCALRPRYARTSSRLTPQSPPGQPAQPPAGTPAARRA